MQKVLLERLEFLTRASALWFTFASTIMLTAAFGIVMHVWDFVIIDEIYEAQVILDHVSCMTPIQRTVHIWLTATVDVLYPFLYGAFFIGVSLKAFGRTGLWLALPSFLVIPVDLFEGFTQVMLLQGHHEYVAAKVWATPAKLTLFFAGSAITAIGLVQLFRQRRP
ncbi:hypothetical protein GCM10009096_02230 [Parasphingorhabdus litoris]|uniref:DUF2269 domain-containing protein n=2 Tax=Parasphingorhabdus litoris TaxID=394733 RepID=A0ABN1A1H4_9SPHN